jgi:hypothetical protein
LFSAIGFKNLSSGPGTVTEAGERDGQFPAGMRITPLFPLPNEPPIPADDVSSRKDGVGRPSNADHPLDIDINWIDISESARGQF